eukprot:m.173864 g.173864  ORF g.173864 m.173864 type:complete len:75 (+) comp15395_c1_seq2:29-253(+)
MLPKNHGKQQQQQKPFLLQTTFRMARESMGQVRQGNPAFYNTKPLPGNITQFNIFDQVVAASIPSTVYFIVFKW